MSLLFEYDIYNDQSVVVFHNYKQYKNINKLNSIENKYYDYKSFIEQSKFNSHKYFSKSKSPLYSDLVRLAKYEKTSAKEIISYLQNLQKEEDIVKDIKNSVIVADDKSVDYYEVYNLGNAMGLYTELAKVEPFNIKSIINFSKTFGLPTGNISFPNTFDKTLVNNSICIPSCNFVELNLQLMEYKVIFEVFESIMMNNTEKIKEREIQYIESTTNDSNNKHINIALRKSKLDYFKTIDDETLLKYETEYLSDLINNSIFSKLFNWSLVSTKKGHKLKSHYNNLFQFAYNQIIHAMLKKPNFKKCEYCEHLFEAPNDKMKFCPTLPFRARSSCEMASRNKRKKKRN
ncbi:hypothetical protein [Virgibacillus proomii]|uniref:hypothetical protein n=1 Tax=Virgibacillus proomii TaxID=84407 RepID=UPI000986AB66|nr:hypothetical protein [Virgibacillus proomii]